MGDTVTNTKHYEEKFITSQGPCIETNVLMLALKPLREDEIYVVYGVFMF
jgi:hypothetical protein